MTDPQRDSPGSRNSTQVPLVPQAIALQVKLSPSTFLRTREHNSANPGTMQDAKVDVYLNGELAHSTLVPARTRHNVRLRTPLFAGTRMQLQLERPWVIVPPGQNADGSLRVPRRPKPPARERWAQVGAALAREAEQSARDAHGEELPSVTFLRCLAALEMPEEVAELQRPGVGKLGVLDVVITLGVGRKTGTRRNLLTRPARLAPAQDTCALGGVELGILG